MPKAKYYGTNDIINDVKQVYFDEFEESRIQYNNKKIEKSKITFKKYVNPKMILHVKFTEVQKLLA